METISSPFYQYKDYMIERYGEPLYRIPMDFGFSCPNRDENKSGGRPDRTSPKGRDAAIFNVAIDFIKNNKDKPFYVNIWGFTTHHPVVSAQNFLNQFSDLM